MNRRGFMKLLGLAPVVVKAMGLEALVPKTKDEQITLIEVWTDHPNSIDFGSQITALAPCGDGILVRTLENVWLVRPRTRAYGEKCPFVIFTPTPPMEGL